MVEYETEEIAIRLPRGVLPRQQLTDVIEAFEIMDDRSMWFPNSFGQKNNFLPGSKGKERNDN